MKMTGLALGACIAWAGLAISMATPADAYMMTWASGGNYANCSANKLNSLYYDAGCQHQWTYQQQVAIITTSCNAGGCSSSGMVYTDMVYGAGRKTLSRGGLCSGGYVYSLGSCAC
jgi:hypothetical protein